MELLNLPSELLLKIATDRVLFRELYCTCKQFGCIFGPIKKSIDTGHFSMDKYYVIYPKISTKIEVSQQKRMGVNGIYTHFGYFGSSILPQPMSDTVYCNSYKITEYFPVTQSKVYYPFEYVKIIETSIEKNDNELVNIFGRFKIENFPTGEVFIDFNTHKGHYNKLKYIQNTFRIACYAGIQKLIKNYKPGDYYWIRIYICGIYTVRFIKNSVHNFRYGFDKEEWKQIIDPSYVNSYRYYYEEDWRTFCHPLLFLEKKLFRPIPKNYLD